MIARLKMASSIITVWNRWKKSKIRSFCIFIFSLCFFFVLSEWRKCDAFWWMCVCPECFFNDVTTLLEQSHNSEALIPRLFLQISGFSACGSDQIWDREETGAPALRSTVMYDSPSHLNGCYLSMSSLRQSSASDLEPKWNQKRNSSSSIQGRSNMVGVTDEGGEEIKEEKDKE